MNQVIDQAHLGLKLFLNSKGYTNLTSCEKIIFLKGLIFLPPEKIIFGVGEIFFTTKKFFMVGSIDPWRKKLFLWSIDRSNDKVNYFCDRINLLDGRKNYFRS